MFEIEVCSRKRDVQEIEEYSGKGDVRENIPD